MHGAGNDFIVIEDLEERFEPVPGVIASLCAPHRGIGADGLILIRPGVDTDFRMIYYNSDGGEAGMCGNGARCAALFAFECGVAGRSMVFGTGSGTVRAEVLRDAVSLNIGDVDDLKTGLTLGNDGIRAHYAVSGVPHLVVISDGEYAKNDFIAMARTLRFDPSFGTSGTNVNLVSVHGKNRLSYRTYERGVEAETLACGTGAVASAVITSHLDYTESPVECVTSGGDILEVAFEKTGRGGKNCLLKGPAVIAFRGNFILQDYIPPA